MTLAAPFNAFEYRKFFQVLLGRWWVTFELLATNLFVLLLGVLGTARAVQTTRQAIYAGLIGACLGTLPAVMLHLSFMTYFPNILDVELPIYAMFERLNITWLKIAYLVVLFGTFIETGAGIVQGVIERVDGYFSETSGQGLSRKMHATTSTGIKLAAAAAASIGLWKLVNTPSRSI